jgi:hypothetical protein
VKLTTHLYVKSRVRIRGFLPPFPMHFQGAGLNWADWQLHVSFLQDDCYRLNTEKHFPIQCSPISVRLNVFNPLKAELNLICHLLVLLGDLTFMGPCIVTIFQYNNIY